MKTKSADVKTTNPNTVAARFRTACTTRLMPLLLLLLLPAAVQAEDYTYTTNSGAITITGYTGAGGALTITNTINGLPVTSIGDFAFSNCTSLASVTIPDSVTHIGNYAFERCDNLASAIIGNSVTNLGTWAFYECTSLTNVVLGTNVAIIGDWAFYFCTGLTSVTIPDSVITIGDRPFANCTSLTSVTIPASVTSIGNWPFLRCTSLSAITVDTNNLAYSSADGVLFNKSQTLLIQCPAGKAGSYTIPNSVITIEGEAFDSCYSLTNVTIGTSVTSVPIGANCAFAYCTNLMAITVDPGNAVYSSVDGVLFNKSQTTLIQYPGGKAGSYTIPTGVTSIGNLAFYAWCTGLTSVTIPNSVTSIGVEAFDGCAGLASVTIGDSVTSIGDYAFRTGAKLTGVYFWGNAPSLGSFVFTNDSNATVYYFPGTTVWGTTFGGLPTAPWPSLTVGKLQMKLNFAKTNSDSCTLTGTLTLDSGFSVTNQPVTVDIGGAQASFTLDVKGRDASPTNTCKLTYKKKTGPWTFTTTLKNGSWATQWEAYGLSNTTTTAKAGVSVTLPVVLEIGDETFAAGKKALLYKAKAGKSGSAK